jgi:hypothetical protein
MLDLKSQPAVVLLLLALVSLPGCESAAARQTPADEARTTLREALESWQKGETPDALHERMDIIAVEPKWQHGLRLLEFEVLGDGEMSGFDWQCKVRLSLQDAKGKKSAEKAIYNISTSPARVIVRYEQ